MLEFKVIENLKPNKDLTNILKNFKYKVKLGQIKTILHTNIFITLNVVIQKDLDSIQTFGKVHKALVHLNKA